MLAWANMIGAAREGSCPLQSCCGYQAQAAKHLATHLLGCVLEDEQRPLHWVASSAPEEQLALFLLQKERVGMYGDGAHAGVMDDEGSRLAGCGVRAAACCRAHLLLGVT